MWGKRVRRVRLHMKDQGPSLEGLLVARAGGDYHLRAAELLEAKDRTIELSGDVRVPYANVSFYQVLPE